MRGGGGGGGGGVIDDNCVFDFFDHRLMDPETALTFTHGHFN